MDPPTVVLRDLASAPRVARGTSMTLEQSTVTIALAGQTPREALAQTVLFLPEGWEDGLSSTGQVRLTLHFHSAPWYAIEEHARRGASHPLIAFYLGEGSSMYQRPFEDRDRLTRVLDQAASHLAGQGHPGVAFAPLEVQSFSAGYGAVRELLKSDEWKRRIRRIVLADSLYASLTTATLSESRTCAPDSSRAPESGAPRVPDPAQMQPFIDYAQRAAAGETQFLFAHSTIRFNSYADTVRTADALICALNGSRETVTTGTVEDQEEATGEPRFPLESRFDRGHAHIWGYQGTSPQAHMAVARTIAAFWRALDQEWEENGTGQ